MSDETVYEYVPGVGMVGKIPGAIPGLTSGLKDWSAQKVSAKPVLRSVEEELRYRKITLEDTLARLTRELGNTEIELDHCDKALAAIAPVAEPPAPHPKASDFPIEAARPVHVDEPPASDSAALMDEIDSGVRASFAIPDGFSLWLGGEWTGAQEVEVNVLLRGGGIDNGPAGEMDWQQSETHSHPNDIVAYQIEGRSGLAYVEGVKARRAGEALETNPYAPALHDGWDEQSFHGRWRDGWLECDMMEDHPEPQPVVAQEGAASPPADHPGGQREPALIAACETEGAQDVVGFGQFVAGERLGAVEAVAEPQKEEA